MDETIVPSLSVPQIIPSSNSVIKSSYNVTQKVAHTIFQPQFNKKCSANVSHVSSWPVFFVQVISQPLRRLRDIEKSLRDKSNTMRLNTVLKVTVTHVLTVENLII